MNQSITPKQQEILDFISKKTNCDGYPPSVREICSAVGLRSPSSVYAHIKTLEEMGLLTKDSGKSRTLRVEGTSPGASISIPVLGQVTAGMPILAVEQIEGYLQFPQQKASGRQLFALHVRGESMINAGILNGDYVVVEKTSYAENGEIVVAMIEDEATVKRFYKENGHFRLQPENPAMDPIITDEVSILGRVVSVMRFY